MLKILKENGHFLNCPGRFEQVQKEGKFLIMITGIYGKPAMNSLLAAERLKEMPYDQEQAANALLPLLFNVVLQVLASTISQEKEIKDIQIRKK